VLRDIEIAGIAAHRRTARVASIELGESLMPKSRPADARHGGATVEAETVPAWVASSEKVGDPLPVADRKGDSAHASNVGESIHRRRRDTQNDTVPAPNTLQCRFKASHPQKAGVYQCDLNHIAYFEPVLSSQHQNVMHASLQGVNSED
jgi:hypothetical protein